MKNYQDKVCVITASATGIGLAIARKLGEKGGKIVVSSRNQEHISKAVSVLRSENIECEGVVCDVSKDRKKLVEFAVSKYGGIDVLVNNAAVSPYGGKMIDTPEVFYDDLFEVNVKSSFFLVKEALPHLKKSQGTVLFVASMAGYTPLPYMGIYSATKACMISMAKFLAVELAPFKIRVNAIAPAVIKTDLAKPFLTTKTATSNPFHRVGEPHECAHAVAFLCSDEASFITGETVVLSGGKYARL